MSQTEFDLSTPIFDTAPPTVKATCQMIAAAVSREVAEALMVEPHHAIRFEPLLIEAMAKFILATGLTGFGGRPAQHFAKQMAEAVIDKAMKH